MMLAAPFDRSSDEALGLTAIDGRGNRLSIDPEAFAANLKAVRARIGRDVRVLQVVKGEGYGLGLARTVHMGMECGVDGFCAGTAEEALRIKAEAPDAFVLLFSGTPPERLPDLAAQDIRVSVNCLDALLALEGAGVECRIFLELDCGFGRYGLDRQALASVLDRVEPNSRIHVDGLYTHFGGSDEALLDNRLARFEEAAELVRGRLRRPVVTMVAATATILQRPHMPYDAVDPGRLLYGIVEGEAARDFAPVLGSVESHILQINHIAEDQSIRIGYGEERTLAAGGRTGVFPLGWFDGLPAQGALGSVLVGGQRVPVIARTLLHSIADLSALADVAVGDRVVLIGQQDRQRIDIVDAAQAMGISATELHFRLAGAITRNEHIRRCS